MSFILNGSAGLVLLPNPSLGNTEALSVAVNHRQSMTGVHYTYVKKRDSDKRRFSFTFENMIKGKMAEVQAFFRLSGGEVISITDHLNNNYNVIFAQSNIEFTTTGLGVPSAGVGGSRDEVGEFTLEFIEA